MDDSRARIDRELGTGIANSAKHVAKELAIKCFGQLILAEGQGLGIAVTFLATDILREMIDDHQVRCRQSLSQGEVPSFSAYERQCAKIAKELREHLAKQRLLRRDAVRDLIHAAERATSAEEGGSDGES